MFRILMTALCACASLPAFSQPPSNTAFAITSKTYGAHEWTEIKEVSLVTGEVVRNVFENSNVYNLFDGRSLRPVIVPSTPDSAKQEKFHPFAGLSAACAYDAKSNRLYYAPMFVNQLRYIDLNASTPGVYVFNNEKLSAVADPELEENQMTRMVIAADGNGYALNNDGKHLVRFTTEQKPVFTELGALNDALENGEVSIHDPNTSFGGDMLSDASGNLYLITAHNYVFRIDVQTKVATFIAQIKDLPQGFTTNGAVVNAEGNIVVSSANFLTSYYTVDPHSWKATTVEPRQQVYNTSDLANQNLLFKTNFNDAQLRPANEQIAVYPNPVKAKIFRVSFANKPSGEYNVQVIDVAGRMVSDKTVMVSGDTQVSEVRMNNSITSGMYFVKVLNHHHKEVYTRKIIIE